MSDVNGPTGGPQILHGFELVREEEVPERGGTTKFYQHVETGLQVVALDNDDNNKVFCTVFRTLPSDSTGVAHILEHCVLSGSEKYPVKDAFSELTKGSLNTFINAFTYPDKTCYPVASTHEEDLHNQMKVYLDLIFNPALLEDAFLEEGWHFELNDEGKLVYSGVVYNEMKGSMSDPERVLDQAIGSSLLPNTLYVHNSGGEPANIPDLSYQEFKDFHKRYYHPSNALLFLSGNGDFAAQLALVDECIKGFGVGPTTEQIPLQPRFEKPVEVTEYYAAKKDDPAGPGSTQKSMVAVNWLLERYTDESERMAVSLLADILLSSPASPLRRALIESGMGEGLTGSGIENDLHEPIFGAGLKGVKAEDCKKVESLILETLQQLAQNGISQEDKDAALNQLEFTLRENETGRMPQGLGTGLAAARRWQYGDDPFDGVKFEAALASLKRNLQDNERFLEEILQEKILSNQHRSTVYLHPDPEKAERDAKQEQERLASIQSQMSAQELESVRDVMKRLEIRQNTPDSPEALASIPRLKVADLDREQAALPHRVEKDQGIQIFHPEINTHGIAYAVVSFDVSHLPERLLAYGPLFGDCLLEMGTKDENYIQLNQRIDKNTGGIYSSITANRVRESDAIETRLHLVGKSIADKSADLTSIMQDLLLKADLSDQERFRQIVLQRKAGLESSVIPGGHQFVARRMMSEFSPSNYLREIFHGYTQIQFLRELEKRIEDDWPAVQAELEEFRSLALRRDKLTLTATVDEAEYNSLKENLLTLCSHFSENGAASIERECRKSEEYEGVTAPMPVNYVCKGAQLAELGGLSRGAAAVVQSYLEGTYLWEQVRIQGGAYGVGMAVSAEDEMVVCHSYRDPNVTNTLRVYDKIADHLMNLELSEADLEKYIIGTINSLDPHLLPTQKGARIRGEYLQNRPLKWKQEIRDQVFATTIEDFRRFGEAMKRFAEKGRVVVLGSREAIGEFEKEAGVQFQVQELN